MAHPLLKVRRFASEGFAWWIGELREMVPQRFLKLFAPPVNELVVEPLGSRLVLYRRNGGGQTEIGAIEIDGVEPEAAKAALRPMLADLDLSKMQIALRLPASRALRKLVDLPAAAEENLRQVLTFEMDRLTPFSPDSVYYDVRVVERDPETRRIKAALTVLPRAAVDPAVDLLRRLGLHPDAVALPRGDPREPPWRVPIASNGVGRRSLLARLPWLLAVLAAALLIASIWVALDRERRQLEALERELVVARKEADEGRRLQEEIARLSGAGNFIVERKRERPPVIEVLNELSRTLPDDTWLYRLRFIEAELQTFGYAPNASALIGLIESSPLFGSAQFRAPLTRDQRIDAEQFHVAFQVRREEAHQ